MINVEIYQGEDLEFILSETDSEIDITLNSYKCGIGKGEEYYPFTFTNQEDGTIQMLISNTITREIAPGTYSGVLFQTQGVSRFAPTAITVRILKTPPEGIPNAAN